MKHVDPIPSHIYYLTVCVRKYCPQISTDALKVKKNIYKYFKLVGYVIYFI